MKRFFVFLFAFALIFSACDTGTNPTTEEPVVEEPQADDPVGDDPATANPSTDNPVIEEPVAEDPVIADVPAGSLIAPTAEEIASDTRLSSFDADGVWWLRKPVKKASTYRSSLAYNISDGDPIAAYCTEPGWSYIFYDDQAVIGYEPFPDSVDIMHNAVAITVEVWNRDHPDQEWGYINVSMPSDAPHDTSNDPVLEVWQYALCTDDGTIVDGPYTAEFDFNWAAFKSGGAALQLELYNRDHDPDAHIVWGPDA